MGKRKRKRKTRAEPQQPAPKPAAPFNNPFGALSGLRDQLSPAVRPAPPVQPTPAPPKDAPEAWGKLVIQREKKGRAGKTVTRIQGLPKARLEELAQRMKMALGCGATQEGSDLILLGSLVERARSWFEGQGARRVVVSGETQPQKTSNQKSPPLPKVTHAESSISSRDGKHRAHIKQGLTVDIVLKRDQRTGTLTRGVVQDILTRSANHPHGIKVRLADGNVGRVKQIIELPM